MNPLNRVVGTVRDQEDVHAMLFKFPKKRTKSQFNKLTLRELRTIAARYNRGIRITNYSKAKKADLLYKLKKKRALIRASQQTFRGRGTQKLQHTHSKRVRKAYSRNQKKRRRISPPV